MEPVIGVARSSGVTTEGGEPGIHNPRPVVMDSGLAAEPCHRTGRRPEPLAPPGI